MAAEGAVAAYEKVVGETWKPFERPVDNTTDTVGRKAAKAQMSAFDDRQRGAWPRASSTATNRRAGPRDRLSSCAAATTSVARITRHRCPSRSMSLSDPMPQNGFAVLRVASALRVRGFWVRRWRTREGPGRPPERK